MERLGDQQLGADPTSCGSTRRCPRVRALSRRGTLRAAHRPERRVLVAGFANRWGWPRAGCAARSPGPWLELHVAAGGQEREPECDWRSRSRRVPPRRARKRRSKRNSLRWVPTKSSTVQNVLPVGLAQPRPSCWRNSVGLSVGRSMSTVSTAGTSTPSLNRSTENTTCTVAGGAGPAGRRRARRRGLSPQTATDGMPCAVKWRAMKRACSTLTQNPRARIVAGVGVLGDLLDDEAGPGVGAGVGVAEGLDVVAPASAPGDVAEVEAVVDAEVEERRQVLLVDGVPEAQLGGDAVVEPVQDRQAVAALGVAVRPSSSTGARWSSTRLVRRRGGVVELVDDHDVEVIGRRGRRGRLALRLWIEAKTCSKRCGSRAADPLLAEGRRRAGRSGTWRGSGRGSPRGGRRTAGGRGRAAGGGGRSRARPSRSCRCRWRRRGGCGGGLARGRRSISSSSRSWNGHGRSSIGLRITMRAVVGAAGAVLLLVELRRRRRGRSRRLPSSCRRRRRTCATHVGVAGGRGPDVPLEPGDLRAGG